MGPPPCRLRSGCPYGPPSFDPRRCPAQRVGIFRRPVQHASVSLRRRPEGLLLRAVPCPRHSRPAAGSRCLRPGGPVRCAAPSRRFSRPAAGSLRLPMQDRVLSISSFRSYRHLSGSSVSPVASCISGVPFSFAWPIGVCLFVRRPMLPDRRPSRAHALPCRHPPLSMRGG